MVKLTEKKHEPLPGFDPQEVAFNCEAVRGYLFSAAEHVLEGMQDQKVEHAGAAVMTGGLEFAAQLWMQAALQAGVSPMKARQTAEKEFRGFLLKHGQKARKRDEGRRAS